VKTCAALCLNVTISINEQPFVVANQESSVAALGASSLIQHPTLPTTNKRSTGQGAGFGIQDMQGCVCWHHLKVGETAVHRNTNTIHLHLLASAAPCAESPGTQQRYLLLLTAYKLVSRLA